MFSLDIWSRTTQIPLVKCLSSSLQVVVENHLPLCQRFHDFEVVLCYTARSFCTNLPLICAKLQTFMEDCLPSTRAVEPKKICQHKIRCPPSGVILALADGPHYQGDECKAWQDNKHHDEARGTANGCAPFHVHSAIISGVGCAMMAL